MKEGRMAKWCADLIDVAVGSSKFFPTKASARPRPDQSAGLPTKPSHPPPTIPFFKVDTAEFGKNISPQ
jgi:hypothetical protein